MNKISCIIVDDEKKDRENLRILLNKYCPEVKILGEAFDKTTIVELFNRVQPQLAFLDIQLEETTIFDILDKVGPVNFQIVFVTAFDDFAIKGYRYLAFDYILKPINYKKLQELIKRFKEFYKQQLNQQITNNEMDERKTITLSDSKGTILVELSKIIYCHSDGNYTIFIMNDDKKKLVISKNLKSFEDQLSSLGFIRIHKSYLVNKKHVSTLIKGKTPHVIMSNSESLRISRLNKSNIIKKLISI